MTDATKHNQVIALAALSQACLLTSRAAREGRIDGMAMVPLVHSLFDLSPSDTPSVYGETARLRQGLDVFLALASGRNQPHAADILRYEFGILHIESRLRSDRGMLERIGHGIEEIGRQFPDSATRTDSACISQLSRLYQNTISTMRKRIHVQGEYQYLHREDLTNVIRTCLLSGIRAAVLWRQLGGSRLHLLLGRNRLVAAARDLRNGA